MSSPSSSQLHPLLDSLNRLAPRGLVAGVLRHAERYVIRDAANPFLAELTPAGLAAAEAFGHRLTSYRSLRLYHSPVKRCWQTANAISQGALAAGLEVEFAGPAKEMGVDYVTDMTEAGRRHVLEPEAFVRRWFSGAVPTDVIQPAPGVADMKLAFIRDRLADASPTRPHLDLHVTHDWNIMILREFVLGVSHEQAGWVGFLDGLVFSVDGTVLKAECHGTERSLGGEALQA